jgi:2-haloacid dehalogenase
MNEFKNRAPAIVFDFGGVLLDWNPRYLYRKLFDDDHEAVERFLDEIGFSEWNVKQDEGRPFAAAVAELSEQFPQHADLIRAYDERWEESMGGEIGPAVEILYALKRAGHSLYGLSNWSAETFRRIRHKYAFLELFDAIVLSGEVKVAKPDPRIYALLLDKINRPAGECLFIDDSEANVAAARRLGFRTIRFESPEQLESELRRLGLLKSEAGTN